MFLSTRLSDEGGVLCVHELERLKHPLESTTMRRVLGPSWLACLVVAILAVALPLRIRIVRTHNLEAMATAAAQKRPDKYNAIDAIQNARNGRSASSDPPLTTNAGTAIKSNVAHTGRSVNRRATLHIAATAISENTMYAA